MKCRIFSSFYPQNPGMEGKLILVVEDHDPLRGAIQGILESEDYDVVAAANGEQALQVMATTRPDLIVADIAMPVMDGYAFYEVVHARQEWVPIPFIFLTAKAQPEDVLKGKELGAEDYLTKPFDPKELLVAVRSRISRARAIQESSKAELEELKHQIVTALGHEIRTPLTYIRGYTDLALEDIPDLSPDMLQEFLQAISKGAERLLRLSDDFLLLTRLDTGLMAEEFRELVEVCNDLDAVVKHAVQLHKEQALAKGVVLEVNMSSDLPSVRLCEPLFEDALSRLVDSAIKFSRTVGKRVIVSGQVVEGQVKIAVADEGIGIPAEAIPHLFERFRQIDRETQEQQGVGLGLAIAQALVSLHGGEINVESTVDKGSTFTIRLPLAEV